MNGYGVPPASAWQEHHTPDGRAYYYNSATKVTQWTKPEDLMSAAERALSNQPWKEYTAEGGRKYWYNTETKQSSWEMPEIYKLRTRR
ncbi:related to U1 snRNP protein [Claviceps purpurea 20.1]|uniref:Related to U1 snRNP protein n=1 Tax=Claviceps purpurea (strain 20.1) TaxID=1111077 RepID=M1WF60_CLAP2|nr:related to U1 snRNP protein [Claviceps purpurea 20.1]